MNNLLNLALSSCIIGLNLFIADLLETAVSGFDLDVVQRRAGNSVPGQGDVVILADLA